MGLGSVPLLPQDAGHVAHRRQVVGVVLTIFAAGDRDDRFEELARHDEIALRADCPGEIVARPQGLDIAVAKQRAAPAYHFLLQPRAVWRLRYRDLADDQQSRRDNRLAR